MQEVNKTNDQFKKKNVRRRTDGWHGTMSDNENYEEDEDVTVVYGTPLPELDEDSAAKKKKPIPIEDQIVTDENGRRRFHGAFTGGFSAGFFNTAGSRDGWSPAHFKSSRGRED